MKIINFIKKKLKKISDNAYMVDMFEKFNMTPTFDVAELID